ncbi:vacuolar protein sorting-associated protein 18 [Marchantia polymorpha subsp. ruderalis]|uniref:Pep3/Vps18/deep orange domain-containing protein n=2 Tax=Marchantia polymorpha TaxID=3197 RepID=A0AAF6B8S4_MARPO|nr:hypothetical protein MARPO_0011s0120 [Marchantia polymorpha]BBN08408.1 hypothetical protein Mp_4g11360 [Marchantia polymorpha subsp. ruderalis]|eukprot:PTQ46443.1 hypothetical protein MARPO_0011s0120 [Marchantia polymorpha]
MLDEWEESTLSVVPASSAGNSNLPDREDGQVHDTPSFIQRNADSPIFSIDTLERHAARSHGLVTSVSAGNNVILVGTNRGWLVRHDFGGGDTLEFDLSASRGVDYTVHKVFIDPGGRHSIASVCSNAGSENYYIHAKWKKPRALPKLKGWVVSAVAWNRQQISDASTRDVVLGTTTGQLFEMSVEEKDKKEKYVNKLFEITEMPEPFIGVQMETVGTGASTRYLVLAATASRLYTFVGTGSLEATFQAYENQVIRFTELPGDVPNSELHFFGKQRRMERFAWLSGPGIYHGHINLTTAQSNEDNHLEQKALLKYSKITGDTSKPCSLALSEFHFLVCYNQSLKVVNTASEEVVEEQRFDASLSSSPMLGLCSDIAAGVYYAYSESSIFEISVNDEGRDMWLTYLNMKEYAAALEYCRDQFQRDQVYATQAEAEFKAGNYDRAASFYAKANSVASFEEVALKFVTAGEQDALRTYLLRKLDHLGKEDRAQITMISTWASELYLDKINRLLLGQSKQKAEGGDAKESTSAEYQATLTEFHAFLSDCKDVLDEATTVKLLGSYGRVDELVFFAGLKEQYETLLHHFVQQGDAKKALAVLRKPNVSPELQYKFGPALIMLDPHATVESWMTASSLSPRRLIPALMRYSSEPHKDEANAAIRYLEFCVQGQQNEDSAIHNLLLSLYAKQEDESALLLFLETKYGKGRPGRPDIFYDPKYALRLCLEEKRMRACVYIYSMMGMYEEAVALALQIDPELAKAQADKVDETDEGLRKKLWLMVARHVIQQEKGVKAENIRKAVAFLKETDGLLKIEDILPFFPDFSLIDDFKEAICTSLEDYSRQIEELKRQMNDATLGADNIRHDISCLTQRYAIVNQDEDCGVCGRLILASKGNHASGPPGRTLTTVMAPFYVFPCEHSFHAQCLTEYVLKHSDKYEKERIAELRNRLYNLINDAPARPSRKTTTKSYDDQVSADGQMDPLDQVRAQLDDAVAGECPFCGELMVREITQPFILAEEQDLVMSWSIGSGTLAKEYGFT